MPVISKLETFFRQKEGAKKVSDEVSEVDHLCKFLNHFPVT